jgi:hypothetical protein
MKGPIEHAVRTAALGLSTLALGVAVQLIVAPGHVYERAFDLFDTAVLVAGISFAAGALWPEQLVGKLLASLALTLLPVMIWFRELPASWGSVLSVAMFVGAFCVTLSVLWLQLPQRFLAWTSRATYPISSAPALVKAPAPTISETPPSSPPSPSSIAVPSSLDRFQPRTPTTRTPLLASLNPPTYATPPSLWNQFSSLWDRFSTVLSFVAYLAAGGVYRFLNRAGVTNGWSQFAVLACAGLSLIAVVWGLKYVYRPPAPAKRRV